jgi:hypothetical protein
LAKKRLPTIHILLTLLLAVHSSAASMLSGTWKLDTSKGELP